MAGACNGKVDGHQCSLIGKKQREGINTPTSTWQVPTYRGKEYKVQVQGRL
jgi:hypothetical protein